MRKFCLTILFGILLAACGRETGREDMPDLSSYEASPRLAARLQESRRLLRSDGQAGAQEELYHLTDRLDTALSDPALRDSVRAEFFRLWDADPSNLHLVDMGVREAHLLGRAEVAERWEQAEMSDTLLPAGLYLRARRMGRRPEALADLNRLLEMDLPPADRVTVRSKIAFLVGELYGRPESVDSLCALLPEFRALGGIHYESRAWKNLCYLLRVTGRREEALLAAEMCVLSSVKAGNLERELGARIDMANLLDSLGELAEARNLLEASVERARDEGLNWPLLVGLNSLSGLYSSLDELDQALECNRETVRIGVALADSFIVPRALVNQVESHIERGELDLCPPLLSMARRWAEAYPHPFTRGLVPTVEAEYWLYRGDFARSESLLEEAARFSGSSAAEDRIQRWLLIGELAKENGLYSTAFRALDKLGELEREAVSANPGLDLPFQRFVLEADLHAMVGAFDRARSSLASAEGRLTAKTDHLMNTRLKSTAALIEELAGDAEGALPLRREALEAAQGSGRAESSADAKLHLARALLELDRYAEARELLESLEMDFERYPSYRLVLLKSLLLSKAERRSGDADRAADILREAFDRAGHRLASDLRAQLLTELGLALREQGDLAGARESFIESEFLLRNSGMRLERSELRMIAGDQIRAGYSAFISLLADHPELVEGADPEQRTLELLEQMRMAALGLKVPRHPELSCPGLALHLLLGEDRSYLWVQDGDEVDLHFLPSREILESRARTLLRSLERPGRKPATVAAADLSSWLLTPLEGVWQPGTLLYVHPDGLLHDLPWAMLPWKDAVVLDHGPIASRSGVRLGETPMESSALLAAGRNETGAGNLSALREAEREVSEIAAAWPGEARLLQGLESSREFLDALTGGEYRAVHLATHARVHQTLAGKASLFIGGEGEAVGASEIEALRIRADLVYLSCCEASRSVSERAGTSFDLSRSFLRAGARSVIASPMRVDDAAARRLAWLFYKNWKDGMCRAEALRRAQLELREDSRWREPYYWAYPRLILGREAPSSETPAPGSR